MPGATGESAEGEEDDDDASDDGEELDFGRALDDDADGAPTTAGESDDTGHADSDEQATQRLGARPSGPPAMPSGGTVMRSGSPVIVPIRRVPGWWRASSSTAAASSASGTTTTKPQPMLKTSHISGAATSPSSRTSPNTGGAGSGSEISKPMSACRRSRFSSPPPVMCARPRTSAPERSSSRIART